MRCAGMFAVMVLVAAANAQQEVSINLAGVKLQNGLNQSRSSAPATISPARWYSYEVSGMVRGSSGLLAVLYPTPISLAELLESFQKGGSAALSGTTCNASGTHPMTVMDQDFSGQAPVGPVTAEVGVHMKAGIDAANIAYFEMTDVVVTPSIVGSMTFTSGTVLVKRVACPPDINGDGTLNLSDFGAFQTSFALGKPIGDFNCDGALNLADFGAFQTAYALGCP
ncbi:MAG: hypothetical protein IT437_13970 [Phycisphaerales bacterium]|nr:hypothetical protein [Phycisphaerales bacterium]